MIPLENQVCTLEQAKILKDEFGLELDSYFAWRKNFIKSKEYPEDWVLDTLADCVFDLNKGLIDNYYPAPNCAEFGVLLPFMRMYDVSTNLYLTFEYDQDGFKFYYDGDYKGWLGRSLPKEHESHAKADLLIDGLREGYIKPEDLKLQEEHDGM